MDRSQASVRLLFQCNLILFQGSLCLFPMNPPSFVLLDPPPAEVEGIEHPLRLQTFSSACHILTPRSLAILPPQLGAHSALVFSISKYEENVECVPRPAAVPTEASCDQVLSTMPATRAYHIFGTNTERSIKIEVLLPRLIKSCKHAGSLLLRRLFPDEVFYSNT